MSRRELRRSTSDRLRCVRGPFPDGSACDQGHFHDAAFPRCRYYRAYSGPKGRLRKRVGGAPHCKYAGRVRPLAGWHWSAGWVFRVRTPRWLATGTDLVDSQVALIRRRTLPKPSCHPGAGCHGERRVPQDEEGQGRDQIAADLGLPPRTVSRILARHGVPRLAECDPMTGEVIRASKTTAVRYERSRPGELVHMDVKKLGKIPDGGGWRGWGQRRPTTSPGPTGPRSATTTSTPSSTTTPGWRTPRSCPKRRARPALGSSPGPRPTSPPSGSPTSSES